MSIRVPSLLNTQQQEAFLFPENSARRGDITQWAVITYLSVRNKVMTNASYVTVGGRLNLSRGKIGIYGYHQQEGCRFEGMIVANFVISKISSQILRTAPLVTHFLSSPFWFNPLQALCTEQRINNVPKPFLLINWRWITVGHQIYIHFHKEVLYCQHMETIALKFKQKLRCLSEQTGVGQK